mgnify:CR=1 FL=1
MQEEKIGDRILYKNNQLIIYNKPAGMPVQADKTGDQTLQNIIKAFAKKSVEPVHRIDRPASGIVLFAKTSGALAALNLQFQNRTIQKTYLAIVKNKPAEAEGELTHFLLKNQKQNRSVAYEKEIAHSKKAMLKYKLIASSDNYHLLEINLLSGRHHQIRAQLAAINSPIKGDAKYGFKRGNPDRSIHLHAWKIQFDHPVSGDKEMVVAPLPEDSLWQFFAEQLL